MIDIDAMSMRQLQLECARILVSLGADNIKLSKFNKMSNHDSVNWYKNVLKWYIDEYGNLPRDAGPGKDVDLLYRDL
jgi:hypothetical protein